MKITTILIIVSIFIACGGEVSSDGNKKTNTNTNNNANTNNNTNTNTNNNTNNQTIDPGGFGPPVQDSGISKPKV